MKTAIEWCDSVWNPVRGCSPVSPGCKNCYAARFAARLNSNPATPSWHGYAVFREAGPKWTGRVALDREKLHEPREWKQPLLVFVNSMSDLFHESLSPEHISAVFAAMQAAHWHRYIVLTKRARRMREFVTDWSRGRRGPLSNLWLGVSAEDEDRLRERVPDLLATPAAKRVLSAEPLLGPLNVAPYLVSREIRRGYQSIVAGFPPEAFPLPQHLRLRTSLDWIIVGGESGPAARPMRAQWVRDIRRVCGVTGTPFFFKQWGAWLGEMQDGADMGGQTVLNCSDEPVRVGKRRAGALLDGALHRQTPEVESHG